MRKASRSAAEDGLGAEHVGCLGEALDRRTGELAVRAAVVLDLGPRLGRLVEELQREFRHTAEHLHQAAFPRGPEALLLAVLVGAVGECLLVNDPQPQQPLSHFVGDHRRAVVGQQRPRQPAFLDRLGEPVDEVLGRLRQIPLQVAAQARVVVEDAQSQRALPAAAGAEHLERAVVEIEMPQRADVLGLVAADLPAAHRMRPGLLRQGAEGRLELSPRRGRTQQRTHHREAEAGPGGPSRSIGLWGHQCLLEKRWEATLRPA